MNIGVIGGGAIGLLISSYLCSEHHVTVYVRREEQKNLLNREGVVRKDSSKPFSINALLINDVKKEDCFIICVKQADVSSILPVFSKIDTCTPLIFLQNGMGHVDIMDMIKQPVFLGVVEHGALKLADHAVQHTGKGSIRLASYSDINQQLNALVNDLNQPDFPVYSGKEWLPLLSEKLIVNAVINPLTALFDIHNGEIIDNPYMYKLAEKLCEETALVLNLDFNEQWKRTQEVAVNTEKNVSSMLKDIREDRKTELEAITGYVVRKNKHISIPNTWFIYNSIKALEVKKGLRNAYD